VAAGQPTLLQDVVSNRARGCRRRRRRIAPRVDRRRDDGVSGARGAAGGGVTCEGRRGTGGDGRGEVSDAVVAVNDESRVE